MRKTDYQRRKDFELRRFDDIGMLSRTNGLQQQGTGLISQVYVVIIYFCIRVKLKLK